MARTSMEQEQVEEAIAAMFINSGLENKEELTYDDFKALMAEHMEQLSNASLKVQGIFKHNSIHLVNVCHDYIMWGKSQTHIMGIWSLYKYLEQQTTGKPTYFKSQLGVRKKDESAHINFFRAYRYFSHINNVSNWFLTHVQLNLMVSHRFHFATECWLRKQTRQCAVNIWQ